MPYSKIVNVVLNSNNKITGSVNNQAQYYVDWGAILQNNKKYKMHFTYMGQANTLTGTKIATVFSDIQTNSNVTTGNGAMSTQFMGYLKIQQYAPNINTNYLTAEDNTNVPLYLCNRPMNNLFTITINDNAATPVLFLDNAVVPVVNAAYIMVLSFQEIEDYDANF